MCVGAEQQFWSNVEGPGSGASLADSVSQPFAPSSWPVAGAPLADSVSVTSGDGISALSRLASHVCSERGLHMEEYRQEVLRRTMAEWPQLVSPQVLRSRLCALKHELCDWNSQISACASCARQKRRCKLVVVVFSLADSAEPPTWLDLSREQWHTSGAVWLAAVHSVLGADEYLRTFFEVDLRVADAEKELLLCHEGRFDESCFSFVAAADSWLRRVKKWRGNIRGALLSDSVPGPGIPNGNWLLFRDRSVHIGLGTGAITCFLCRKCLVALRPRVLPSGRLTATMPAEPRANGMWRGPDPAELHRLSYTDAKVINLARVYVSVKRAFLNRGSYAETSASETALYHQKNVVAYPQNPDGALRSLGMSPAAWAKIVAVQFVGENREALRREKDLSVSVRDLRGAFHRLSLNSWPFMETTKSHDVWGGGTLHVDLEPLVQAYGASVGGVDGGTPREIVQGASQIPLHHATVHAAGPADTGADGAHDVEAEFPDTGPPDDDNNCAAVLGGGVDDIGPTQLWDIIMKKCKVAQHCDAELLRLKNASDLAKRDQLEQERPLAIHAAVDASSKLNQAGMPKNLEEHTRADRGEGASDSKVKYDDCFLSSNNPLYWFTCFVELLPRGDCWGRFHQRSARLSPHRWAKCLLTRADC